MKKKITKHHKRVLGAFLVVLAFASLYNISVQNLTFDFRSLAQEPACTPTQEGGPFWASQVAAFNQGRRHNNSPVIPPRSDPQSLLGAPDAQDSPPQGHFSLGFGGSTEFQFEQPVANVPGNDLSFYEFRAFTDSNALEKARVEVSENRAFWSVLSPEITNTPQDGVTNLDISSATPTVPQTVNFVRIIDTTDPSLHTPPDDGIDIDAIGAVNLCVPPQLGFITVDKIADPANSTQQFEIQIFQSGVVDSVQLANGQSHQFVLTPGEYQVFEPTQSGWKAPTAVCDGTPYNNGAQTLVLSPNQNISCTYTNVQMATVVVTKYNDQNNNGQKDDGEVALSGWTIFLFPGTAQDTIITDSNGQAVFTVEPGQTTLSEQTQVGWEQTNISCDGDSGIDADNSHPITVSPGQTLNCQIGNRQIS